MGPFNNQDTTMQDACSANYGNVEIFPWTVKNNYIQYFSDNFIVLGGVSSERLDTDILYVLSEPCMIFDNPMLSQLSVDGIFEVPNIEVWTLIPCMTLEHAKKLEDRKELFGLAP